MPYVSLLEFEFLQMILCRLVNVTGETSVDQANTICIEVVNNKINSEFGMYEGAPSAESDTDSSRDSNVSRRVYLKYTV